MSAQSLLVAGPFVLDAIGSDQGLVGGGGAYAAIAAAPLSPTQFWSRLGGDIGHQRRDLLKRRRIDLAGCGDEGTTSTWTREGDRFVGGGPALPKITPTGAENVGAILLIDLPADEMNRAVAAAAMLPGASQRTVVIAPRPASSDTAHLSECAKHATVLILPVPMAQKLTGRSDALGASQALIGDGSKSVILTAGMLGGVIAYRGKVCTYPAMPTEVTDPTGARAAFAGALSAWLATDGHADFRSVKRGVAMASSVAGACISGLGPKKLLALDHKEYVERFNKLRRLVKF